VLHYSLVCNAITTKGVKGVFNNDFPDDDYSIATELLDAFTNHKIFEVIIDQVGRKWYHNKAFVDELHKDRHVASYASMIKDFIQVIIT
jgi:hypothetical protein